jgi:hypothetical protein
MKKFTFILFVAFLSSCITVKQIGKVNMISNRNVDPNLKYTIITTYSGGSDSELKKSKATTIEDAVDKTVKKVPGGEFVMNVKIYRVSHGNSGPQFFAVEGDVWGNATHQGFRGFKVGDRVTWKQKGKFYNGTIIALKDDKSCLIEDDTSDKTIEQLYDDITKTK